MRLAFLESGIFSLLAKFEKPSPPLLLGSANSIEACASKGEAVIPVTYSTARANRRPPRVLFISTANRCSSFISTSGSRFQRSVFRPAGLLIRCHPNERGISSEQSIRSRSASISGLGRKTENVPQNSYIAIAR